MYLDDEKLKELLVQQNYVSIEDIERAEKSISKNQGNLYDYLLEEGLMTKDLLGQSIAEAFGVPYADLNSNQPPKGQVLKIPEEIAKEFRVILFNEIGNTATICTDNPDQENLLPTLKTVFPKHKINIVYSLPDDIDINFSYYRKSLETRFSQIIKEHKRVAPEIIEQILSDAIDFFASDIHFEPQIEEVLIRFRIDGVLQEAGRIPKEYYENILNRIKVQNQLRIDEHNRTQDGSMSYEKNGRSIDIRTSIAPTIEGEKVVLRILAAYVESLGLTDLGLSEKNQEILERAVNKPFGMILVTGPTGSGKTTTLYALLKILNRANVNITTIEDPVEYKTIGVNQIQVNPQTDLTFARGLRSIVRQDPDIIMVGEIRDEETSEIAVNAALTGHLLLSTFHANNASTAIPRLLDMNIEPFLLASTLEVVIAQRLIRKICEGCRYSKDIGPSEIPLPPKLISKFFGGKKKITLYAGKGCESCGQTGFKGRTGIFEFIEITPDMQELFLKHPSTQEIWNLAQKEGAISLFEDGIEKVKQGVTTIEELKRIAEMPDDARK